MSRFVALLLGLLLSSSALAQSAPEPKSPGLALGLPLGITPVGYFLVLEGVVYGFLENDALSTTLLTLGTAGIVIGPSAGHLYAGEFGHAAITSGARGLGVLGLFISDGYFWGSDVMSVASVFVIVGSSIYDVIDAPFAAKRESPMLRMNNDKAFTLEAPGLFPHPGRALAGLGGAAILSAGWLYAHDKVSADKPGSVLVAPLFLQDAQGGNAPGLSLNGRF